VAQIDLAHTYSNSARNAAGNMGRLSLTRLEVAGCKYLKVDKINQVIELFHLDHSPYKTISFAQGPFVTTNPCEVMYVTQSLFDLNLKIEFLISGVDKNGDYRTLIYDEDGKVLLDETDAFASHQVFPLEGQGPVYQVPGGARLLLDYRDGSVGVFDLPGNLPEADCGFEWVELLTEKGQKTIIHRVDTVFLDGMQVQYRQDTMVVSEEDLKKLEELKNRPIQATDITQLNENQIRPGTLIGLGSLRFERGETRFVSNSTGDLKRLLDLMETFPALNIRLEGHTDSRFDSMNSIDSNHQLSVRRVIAVKKWLEKKGIDGSRIQTIGYGGSRPVASNAREETRKLNRRVEALVITF
jgi:outer membrane protein OmpA-like peptidoglycan-associated protein